MSLAALVSFAQNFGPLAESTLGDEGGETTSVDAEQLAAPNRFPPRPGLPLWLRERTADQELPRKVDYPWRIDEPTELQQPPSYVNALGADALAFYAPFHFYRKGWGIFIRMSGVVYLAQVLKAGSLQPGDER